MSRQAQDLMGQVTRLQDQVRPPHQPRCTGAAEHYCGQVKEIQHIVKLQVATNTNDLGGSACMDEKVVEGNPYRRPLDHPRCSLNRCCELQPADASQQDQCHH